jgi:peptide/nickel transport system substrate-binding protein
MHLKFLGRCTQAIALAACLTLVGMTPTIAQQKGGKAVIASAKIASLNPLHVSAAVGLVSPQVYGTLVRMNDDWDLQPNLADSWAMGDDSLSFTFNLNADATFHDGAPVTSADVKYSLETSLANHRFGPAMFGAIESVETPDPQTVVFKLSRPSPAILRSMTSPRFLPIVPKHIFDDGQEFMKHPRHADPVGSGPFKVVDNGLPSYLVLEPFEEWALPGPYLDQIVFQVIGDQSAVRVGFQRGEFHLASGTALSTYRDLENYDSMEYVSVDPCCEGTGSMFAMDMNSRRPPLDDVRVREAISLAINRPFITEKLHLGRSFVPTGPIVASNPFGMKDAEPLEYDQGRAKALLDEAGYPAGSDGTRFELSLIHLSIWRDLHITVGEYLVPQLAEVGIKINREQMPDTGSWGKRVSAWDYDLALMLPGNFHDPTVGVSRLYVCDNIKNRAYTNTSGYCDPEVDALFSQAAIESDELKRKNLYRQVGERIRTAMPITWIAETPSQMIRDVRLQNMSIGGWGFYGPMDRVWWNVDATK